MKNITRVLFVSIFLISVLSSCEDEIHLIKNDFIENSTQIITYGKYPDTINIDDDSNMYKIDFVETKQFVSDSWEIVDTKQYNSTEFFGEPLTSSRFYKITFSNTNHRKTKEYNIYVPLISTDNTNINLDSTPSPILLEVNVNSCRECSVKWQKSSDGKTWTDIIDETNYVYQPEPLTQRVYYRVILVCHNAYSNIIELNVI